MANTSKRRGMSPILAFILGILFGMILLIGGVVAAVLIVLNTKVDSFDFINKDEKGNYIYINGDPENGGIETLKDLVGLVSDLMSDTDSLTLGKLENSLPVTKSLTKPIVEMLNEYVAVDEEELKAKPFGQLGDYFQDLVMDINVSTLLDKFGGDLSSNKLLGTFLYGKEAQYLEHEGIKYAVFYDEYTEYGSSFVGENIDTSVVPDKQVPYLEKQEEEGLYRLYFIQKGEELYVCQKTDDGYVYLADDADMKYNRYNEPLSSAYCTGNFYYAGGDTSGEKVVVHPVTIRSLTDGSAIDNLNDIMLTDLLGGDEEGEGIVYDVLGGISIGKLIDGEVDFDKVVEDIKITSFVDVQADNNIMLYLGYGLTNVRQIDGKYYGDIKVGEDTVTCEIALKEGEEPIVSEVFYMNGDEKVIVEGSSVQELSDKIGTITDDLALADLIDIPAPTEDESNAIMIFLAYSIADIEKVDETHFSGMYYDPNSESTTGVECTIEVEGTHIKSAYYMDGSTKVPVTTTKVAGVPDQLNRLKQTLTLKDVIPIDESNKLMKKLASTKLDKMDTITDTITLDDFLEVEYTYNGTALDVQTSETILGYLAYGITGIELYNTDGYQLKGIYHDGDQKLNCFIKATLDGSIYKVDEVCKEVSDGIYEQIGGTAISGISPRMDGVTNDLTLGELLNTDGNNLLDSLSKSTISSLSTDINKLSVNQLYADSIYAPNTNVTNYDAKMYQVVASVSPATGYNENFIYYVQDGANYKLATTTGKLTSNDEYTSLSNLYTAGEGKILYNPAYLYYEETADGSYKMVGEDGRLASPAAFEPGKTYYTYGAPNAMWKLMLYATDESSGAKYEAQFSVNGLGTLVTHLTGNFENTTMYELYEAGILTFEGSSNPLNKNVQISATETKKLGELNLSQMIAYISNIPAIPTP